MDNGHSADESTPMSDKSLTSNRKDQDLDLLASLGVKFHSPENTDTPDEKEKPEENPTHTPEIKQKIEDEQTLNENILISAEEILERAQSGKPHRFLDQLITEEKPPPPPTTETKKSTESTVTIPETPESITESLKDSPDSPPNLQHPTSNFQTLPPKPLPLAKTGGMNIRFPKPPPPTPGTGKKSKNNKQADEDIPALDKIRAVSPMDVFGEEEEEESFRQLDMGPLFSKKFIASPIDLLSPDELTEEEEFVSCALPLGTILKERYRIDRLLSETREQASYLVTDLSTINEKNTKGKQPPPPKIYTLKEITPGKIPREEYKKRRDKFFDLIRIISTFKHPNLAEVYEGFSENGREYSLMEKIEGLDLVKVAEMNTRPFAEKEVVRWGLELCDAVEFLHYRPTPFTLGELKPPNIMVGNDGKLKIVNYDLHRFFDVNRNLDFVPDNPTKLYSDITKLARIFYFLLTKKYYRGVAEDITWPDHVSKKMRKLIEIACRDGQLSFGDIKVFRQKLQDTQLEDKEILRKKRRSFPLQELSFAWIVRGVELIRNQHPLLKYVELVVIVFALFYMIAVPGTRHREKIYTPPPKAFLAYLFTKGEMITINADTYEIIYRTPIRAQARNPFHALVNLSLPEEKRTVPREVLMVGDRIGSDILVIDLSTNEIIKRIETDFQPEKILADRSSDNLWVLQGQLPKIFQIDKNTLNKEKLILLEDVPTDGIVVPGFQEQKPTEPAEPSPITDDNEEDEQENILRGYVLSFGNSRKLQAFHPVTGEKTGSMNVTFTPDKMTLVLEQGAIYILDKKNNQLAVVDYYERKIKNIIDFPPDTGKPSDMVYDYNFGKLWFSFKETNNICMLDVSTNTFGTPISSVGTSPTKLLFEAKTRNLWILCEESKDLVVKSAIDGKLVRRIPLGNTPVTVDFVKTGQ